MVWTVVWSAAAVIEALFSPPIALRTLASPSSTICTSAMVALMHHLMHIMSIFDTHERPYPLRAVMSEVATMLIRAHVGGPEPLGTHEGAALPRWHGLAVGCSACRGCICVLHR